ncbi:MAG TPA: CheR family methyltransferase [Candidatus Acidoferrales bacterium]|nr:CheR family methyltransferase [Candidatus Acidoferrales bacterium]
MTSSETSGSDGAAPPSFLVVTGSSAGGIDALTTFASHLPAQLPVPIVVAQHLSPQHESHLADILSKSTPLNVETIAGEAEVKSGTIYVVPPRHDVEVLDSIAATKLQLCEGPKPSIDRLFTTAADVYGDRLIAIIFSGMGSDGARGARAVKYAGGTVIVQEPSSAGYPSMPLAIPPTLVDITAPPEAMGTIIADLLGIAELPTEANEKNVLRTLLAQLREHSGIDFSQYKMPTIMRRLSRLMISSGVATISEYLTYLSRNPDGYQRLANAFLIKVTEFFRDAALFEMLRDHILPEVMLEAREQSREVRIWSAGTSTGEEAYSLAIVCAELMRDEAPAVSVRIFATDVDEQAIAFARRGIYTADSLHGVPDALVERYFTKIDDRYEVAKRIRNMTVFGQHDLGQRAPFPRIDLVLCRNVLIYFTKELQTRALHLFAFALRNGGSLVLGKAESTTPLPQHFKLYNSTLKIYERVGERVILPPARLKGPAQAPPLPFPGSASRELRLVPDGGDLPRGATSDALAAYTNASDAGVVVVDKNYDIVAINSAARAMLQIHGVGVGSDLIHLLPATGAQLRATIDSVLAGEPAEPTSLLASDPVTGIDRWLQIHCSAQRSTAGFGETVGIVIVDVTGYERRLAELNADLARVRAELGEQSRRSQELSSRAKSMLAANQELTAVNADLRTYNEQLLVNAEEAASANEEIETLNEEMQATNEELETLNEELQATVEELNTTNDELEARGTELEEANRAKQAQVETANAQRTALSLALNAVAPPCAIVTAGGEIRYIARQFAELDNGAVSRESWWRRDGEVTLASAKRYVTAVRRLEGDVFLVVFEPANGA